MSKEMVLKSNENYVLKKIVNSNHDGIYEEYTLEVHSHSGEKLYEVNCETYKLKDFIEKIHGYSIHGELNVFCSDEFNYEEGSIIRKMEDGEIIKRLVDKLGDNDACLNNLRRNYNSYVKLKEYDNSDLSNSFTSCVEILHVDTPYVHSDKHKNEDDFIGEFVYGYLKEQYSLIFIDTTYTSKLNALDTRDFYELVSEIIFWSKDEVVNKVFNYNPL